MSNRKVVTVRLQLECNDDDLGSLLSDVTDMTNTWDGTLRDVSVDDDHTGLIENARRAEATAMKPKSKSQAKRLKVQLERKNGAKARRVKLIPGRPSWSYRLKQAVYDWIAGDKRRCQKSFARLVHINPATFNKMMNGLVEPNDDQKAAIGSFLSNHGIPMHWEVYGDDKPRREHLQISFPDGSKAIV